MLFDTFSFLVFLCGVVLGFHLLATRYRQAFLLLASYGFYAAWDYRFCSLLLGSTVFAYWVGQKIETASSQPLRKRWVVLAIVANLLLLGFFKYFDFFLVSTQSLLTVLGLRAHLTTLQLILPVGISFFTFQKIAYTVDIYRRQARASREPLSFALYVAFFPQLLAGPIERPSGLLQQLEHPRAVTRKDFAEGASMMLVGLTKKVCVADLAAESVNQIFAAPHEASALTLLVGMYLFALQIYGDFSGYSQMARGMARFFGVELVANFRTPYAALSFKEFWSRWHISLSQWLRDYVYIPLGGNRRGEWRTRCNLVVTMLLGGLWHGANWTFAVWGVAHGLCLVVEKWLVGLRRGAPRTSRPLRVVRGALQWFVVFNVVTLLWVLFRCSSFTQAIAYFSGLVRGGTELSIAHRSVLAITLPLLLLLDVPQWMAGTDAVFVRGGLLPRSAAHAGMVCLVITLWKNSYAPFIYFQF
jgi:alginate O-acetyltransferase complex protein AlgI